MGLRSFIFGEDILPEIKARIERRNPVNKIIIFLKNKGYKDEKKIKSILITAITEQLDEEIFIGEAKLAELIEKESELKDAGMFEALEAEKILQKIDDATVSIDCIKRKKKSMLSEVDMFMR